MTELKLKHVSHGNYLVFINKQFFGSFVCEVDGYYVWYPTEFKGGAISSYILKMIADKLDAMNKDWDEQIKEYFKNNPQKNIENDLTF